MNYSFKTELSKPDPMKAEATYAIGELSFKKFVTIDQLEQEWAEMGP